MPSADPLWNPPYPLIEWMLCCKGGRYKALCLLPQLLLGKEYDQEEPTCGDGPWYRAKNTPMGCVRGRGVSTSGRSSIKEPDPPSKQETQDIKYNNSSPTDTGAREEGLIIATLKVMAVTMIHYLFSRVVVVSSEANMQPAQGKEEKGCWKRDSSSSSSIIALMGLFIQ